ncbi:MAG: hypothetical protein COA47_08590 [Robiginitomaculum sp.]|nr:MAG: hypothetical protein COA47_08590 [Robiginitomaculum sp.]
MYLSQQNIGPGSNPNQNLIDKIMMFLRKSMVWVVGVSFAALAAMATFFFAMAAIIGTFILVGTVAFAWFVFKLLGPKRFTARGFKANGFDAEGPETLDAERGPEGWTVNGRKPFGH